MKKLLLIMLTALLALPAMADDDQLIQDDIIYNLYPEYWHGYKNIAVITGNTFAASGNVDLVIPESVSKDGVDYKVYEIGQYAFKNCTSLTSVIIPNTVESLYDNCFFGCSQLATVKIPDSVGLITYGAFANCTSLTTVDIPNSVWSIYDGCFAGCSKLATVKIPDSLGFIPNYAFQDCTSLTTVDIPNSVQQIGREAFYGCSALTNVSIPNSVTAIEERAFAKVNIWEMTVDLTEAMNIQYFGDFCFGGGDEGGHVALKVNPENLYNAWYIGDYVFAYTDLEYLVLPKIQQIREDAFMGCSKLFSVMLPDGDTCKIWEDAFKNCTFLNKVSMHKDQDKTAFSDKISVWTYDEGETVDFEKGIIWPSDIDPNGYPWVSGAYEGELVMPANMTGLPWSSIANCKKITKVVLDSKVTWIGAQAFMNCEALTEVVLPTSVTEIYDQVFLNCKSLTDIVIPNRVTKVGSNISYGCDNLAKVAFPSNIQNPFISSAYPIVYDVYDSYVADNFVFSRTKDMIVYVPTTVGVEYRIPESVTSIDSGTFARCKNLKYVWLPAGLTTIGDNAWTECPEIKEITCLGTKAPTANANVFDPTVYDNATLYVPKGCRSAYTSEIPWKYFFNIAEGEGAGSGVEEVIADFDPEAPVEVYDFKGMKVADNAADLPAGLYIFRQGRLTRKVIVR